MIARMNIADYDRISPWLSLNEASRYARCRTSVIKAAALAGALPTSPVRHGQLGRLPALLVCRFDLDKWIIAGRPTSIAAGRNQKGDTD